MDSKTTGKFIAKKRKEKKLTQNELADLLQVTDKAVSRWETGEGFPEISILPKLADRLGCSIDEILNGESESYTPNNDLKAISKFEMTSILSIGILVFGYLIGIMLIYLTEDKYWALLPFFTFGFIGIGSFIYFRYRYIIDSSYQDSDKQRIKRYTWKIIIIGLSLIYALLPMYILVLTFNFLGTQIIVEDSYLRFSAYLWIAPLAVLMGDMITVIILQMVKIVKYQLSKGDYESVQLISSIAFIHMIIIFIISYRRISHDTLLIIIPFVILYLIIPYLVAFIMRKQNALYFLYNFIFGLGITLASLYHYDHRKIYIPDGFGGRYELAHLARYIYLIFALVFILISVLGLIKELKTKDHYTLGVFVYKNLIFLSIYFYYFFVYAANHDWNTMRIISFVLIPIWFLQDFYMRFSIRQPNKKS